MTTSPARVHINLLVSDLEASKAFYAQLFDQPPSKVKDDYANWRLDSPAIHLALVHEPGRPRVETPEHFGVEIHDDAQLVAWGERLEAAGFEVSHEEAVTCCYAVANKRWVRDPDGNAWELWVRHDDADTLHEMPMTALQTAGSCTPTSGPDDAPC